MPLDVGTLSGWLTLIAVVSVSWIFYKGGGGTALSSLKLANGVLEDRVNQQAKVLKAAESTIAALQASRDFTEALTPVLEMVVGMDKRQSAYVEAHLAALDRIAALLEYPARTRELEASSG